MAQPGRYKLRDGWGVPNLPGVEPDEIAAFFALRALAESWRTTAIGKPLDRLWAKLASARTGQTSLLPSREAWFVVRSPIAIDYRRHAKIIATFEKAVRERIVVTCRYRSMATKQVTAHQIEPGELYWDPGLESLYVIGWCRLRSDVRVFALQRFAAAALTTETFAPRAETRSKVALRSAFRVWRGANVESVKVRFSRNAADEIRERRWGPGQRLEEESGGGVVLTLEVVGSLEVQRWLLGFAEDAEVLEPAGLRRLMADRLRRGAERYERRPAGRASSTASERRNGRLTQPDNARAQNLDIEGMSATEPRTRNQTT